MDARNAGNDISGIHAWYIGHTRGLQPLLSPLIYYLTERSLFKPPPGKSLKKALIIAAWPDRSSFLLSTIVQQMVAIWQIWMTPMPSYTVPVFFLFTRHRTAPKGGFPVLARSSSQLAASACMSTFIQSQC